MGNSLILIWHKLIQKIIVEPVGVWLLDIITSLWLNNAFSRYIEPKNYGLPRILIINKIKRNNYAVR